MTKAAAVLPPIRCDETDLMLWRAAAGVEGLSLSEWVRQELDRAARHTLARKPTTTR